MKIVKIFLILIPLILSFAKETYSAFTFVYPTDNSLVNLDCENENLNIQWYEDFDTTTYFDFEFSLNNNLLSKFRSVTVLKTAIQISQDGRYTLSCKQYKEEDFNNPEAEYISDYGSINFQIICKRNEVEENSDPPLEEEITEEIAQEDIVEEKNIIEDKKVEETKGDEPVIKNTVKKVKTLIEKVSKDVRDIFTWNIYFKEIDYDSIFNKKDLQDSNISENVQEEKENTKPFGFPFEKIIGVTQWYGNTVYQQPHTGIDFGATKENIISPDDGEIVALGWDNFNGNCFSGGNYLVVKHTNGMHTAYFHIEKYFVKLGTLVKRNDLLAISGNSGKWNCQNLGYHLHFETRLGRYQETHVNPVEYIDVDWDKVPTIGHKITPGRLSGLNPHPNF
jgi:murein DD-endopeptidase MepM/ murein hydrolase activator NlpD